MRSILAIVLFALAALPGGAAVAAEPATRPTTRPAEERASVLVLPLVELSEKSAQPWIGHAVQQTLVAELARQNLARVETSPADQPRKPLAQDEAIALAKEAGATSVVFGTYQLLEQQIRLTAVWASEDGSILASLKATGPTRELFQLQDELADQLRRAVVRRVAPPIGGPDRQKIADAMDLRGPVRLGDDLDDFYDDFRTSDLAAALSAGDRFDNESYYRRRYTYSEPGYYYYGPPVRYYSYGPRYYHRYRPHYRPSVPIYTAPQYIYPNPNVRTHHGAVYGPNTPGPMNP